MDQSSTYCPICGSNMINGVCYNCARMDREKGKRIGDRGGKRFERRSEKSGNNLIDADWKLRINFHPRRRYGSKPEPMRSSAKTLVEGLTGSWREAENRVIVMLDTKKGTYASRRPNQPGARYHRLRVEQSKGQDIRLYKDDALIEAHLYFDGHLGMTIDGKEYHFFYSDKGKDKKLCPKCYSRSEIYGTSCAVCGWRFAK